MNNNNVDVRGCGCRYRKYPNTNYNNDILVECEYMCEDHKNKFILDLFNKPLRLQQQKEYIDFSL